MGFLQRALVDAFSPSPSLAAALVRKALQLQQLQVGLTVHQLFSSLYLTLLLLLATFPSPAKSWCECLDFSGSYLSCSMAQEAPTNEPGGSSSHPLGHSMADLTMADVDLTAPLGNPYLLDLHGLSKAAARVALHVVCSILFMCARVCASLRAMHALRMEWVSSHRARSLIWPCMSPLQ